ncbi:sortase domain-bontaining protein [Actinopolymorpha alba]|uniref:sortase domain-containing protein n=1 Tax=Actinopolymorpha alba TaxID=533267 RepID=UPI00036DB756|nr:sortase [Actinopolymorpha alba]
MIRRQPHWLVLTLALGATLAVAAGCAGRSEPETDRQSAASAVRTAQPSPGAASPGEARQTDDADGADAHSSVPARLVIPKLRVSATVHGIGMSNDPKDPSYRTLVPPTDPATVGWWQDGPKPGAEVGSVLIVGHTKKVSGVVGVGGGALGHISRLRPGDRINLFTDRGVVRYAVTEVTAGKEFGQVAQDAHRIDDRAFPGGRLVLITCWYDGSRFTGNTFAFARPV